MIKGDYLQTTPTIPDEVFGMLPANLRACTDLFIDRRERDVVMTSLFAALGACFTSCKGRYADRWYRPNSFVLIVAPPASGKGVMSFVRLVGNEIQDVLNQENEKRRMAYKAKLNWLKKKEKEGRSSANAPEKPKNLFFLIPGNSSSASIYKRLQANGGVGMMLETEADSLSGAIRQQWGDFSDFLRKAFEHETASKSRDLDDLYLEIPEPKLSVILSGTPDQVPRLIGSAEDGLCSRFIFYCFSRTAEWKDVTPCADCPDTKEVFLKLGKQIAEMKCKLDKGNHTFKMTEEQFARLNKEFSKKIQAIKPFEGEGAASAVIRLGVISFRLAMVLTIVRELENASDKTELCCSDVDFDAAMRLAEVYFEHAMAMYSMLPKHEGKQVLPRMRSFVELLPKDGPFTTARAIEQGKALGLCDKTVGNHLRDLCKMKIITQLAHGKYGWPKEE
jgi:hypothetical protein